MKDETRHIKTLERRLQHLSARINYMSDHGKDRSYDLAERAALRWAINKLKTAARDRRIAELEAERDEARDLYTATETQRGREVLNLGREVADLEERLRAAESRAARAVTILSDALAVHSACCDCAATNASCLAWVDSARAFLVEKED